MTIVRQSDLTPNLALAYTNRGATNVDLGRPDKALEDHSMAIRLDPNFALAYTNRGATKSCMGRHQEALKDHCEAIRLNPGLAIAFYNRGTERGRLGSWKMPSSTSARQFG